MKRQPRAIVPALPARVRYPRFGVVWGAFAAGTLGPLLAHADCALPDHTATTDATPSSAAKRQPLAVGDEKGAKKAAEPKRISMRTAGVPARVEPVSVPPTPAVTPVVDGQRPSVAPPVPGGLAPAHPATPPPQPPKKPPAPPSEEPHAGLDEERSVVIHPHGPDEPCHHGDGRRYFVRFG